MRIVAPSRRVKRRSRARTDLEKELENWPQGEDQSNVLGRSGTVFLA